MSDQKQLDALARWHEISREQTENAIVSSMFESGIRLAPMVDQFSTWLLVGTAAVAAFFITNSDKVLPVLGSSGFIGCGIFLCLSCVFGFVAKTYGLRSRMSSAVIASVTETFNQHLKSYEEEEQEISDTAQNLGVTLETGVRWDRIMTEFFSILPKWVVWLAQRNLKKYEGNPQTGYIAAVKIFNRLGIATFLQSVSFLGFLVTGFVFTAAA